MSTLLEFKAAIIRKSPPWLRRRIGGKVMRALASIFDELRDSTAAGVKLRFPTDTVDPDALAYIGRERRIRRGPGESATTYARRLRPWLADHRDRGNAYAMLRQLHAVFLDSYNPRIDVIANVSGKRHTALPDGEITRDFVSDWEGDGTDKWARIWVIFYLDEIPSESSLIDDGGELLVTESGAVIVAIAGGGDVTGEIAELFTAIPREWNAAHIDRLYIVLLPTDAELWDYPEPVGTWDDPDQPAWDESVPVILQVDT